MNIQSLIEKFKSNNQVRNCLTVVVLPGELYFSRLDKHDLASKIAVEGTSWQDTLRSTLDDLDISNLTLDLVLNSKLYQTYQIDKPNIPATELAGALPFLLKDLISRKSNRNYCRCDRTACWQQVASLCGGEEPDYRAATNAIGTRYTTRASLS